MLMSMCPAAQRNESRWHSTAEFCSGMRMILPGYGPLKATFAAGTLLRKKVRKRLSPASSFRFSPPRMPPSMRASISMPSVM